MGSGWHSCDAQEPGSPTPTRAGATADPLPPAGAHAGGTRSAESGGCVAKPTSGWLCAEQRCSPTLSLAAVAPVTGRTHLVSRLGSCDRHADRLCARAPCEQHAFLGLLGRRENVFPRGWATCTPTSRDGAPRSPARAGAGARVPPSSDVPATRLVVVFNDRRERRSRPPAHRRRHVETRCVVSAREPVPGKPHVSFRSPRALRVLVRSSGQVLRQVCGRLLPSAAPPFTSRAAG